MARKQQFMLYLSKKENVGNVIYVEPHVTILQLLLFPFSTLNSQEKRNRWKRALSFRIEPVTEKLYLYTPLYYLPFAYKFQPIHNINLFLSSFILRNRVKRLSLQRTVIWLYPPFDCLVLRLFRNRVASVFDWAEEWADYFIEFSKGKRKRIAEQEKEIIQKVDVVFTVSKALYDKARAWNKNTYQLFDGTATELFLSPDVRLPSEMKSIQKPVIGYIGTIMERFDSDLILSMSEQLPQASIVLIGDAHRHRIDITALEKKNNVFFLGGKYYSELPAYVNNFDVCIIPYKEGTFIPPPTKIFDYLASGKPVVSIPFPEYERFSKYIKVARGKAEFIAMVKDAISERSAQLRDERITYAKANSWEVRTDELLAILEKHTPPPCKLCGNIDTYILDSSETPYKVLECKNCGFIAVFPLPDMKSLTAHYDESYYEAFIDQSEAKKKLWSKRLEGLHRFRKQKKGKLLDIGCGDGLFLSLAKKNGWEAEGTELSAWAAPYIKKTYDITVYQGDLSTLPLAQEHYDVITSWHSIEHMPDPLGMLNKVSTLLKKDGMAVIACPNTNSHFMNIAYFCVKLRRDRLFSKNDREVHLSHFNDDTLKKALLASGFEIKWMGLDLGFSDTRKRIIDFAAYLWYVVSGKNWSGGIKAYAQRSGKNSEDQHL